MSKSTRTVLAESMEVEVLQFRQVTENLGVLSFMKDNVRFDDIYNIESKETMDTLLLDRAGAKVFCTISPDTEEDKDGHPSIDSARVEEVAAA